MTDEIADFFSPKKTTSSQGPSAGELAAARDRLQASNLAANQEASRAAISSRLASMRQALKFREGSGFKSTFGG